MFRPAPTGERLTVAPAAQPEDPGAMSMPASPSLPACFASLDALLHASHCVFSRSLHRCMSAVSNAFWWPKIKYISPVAAIIDLSASRRVSSGLGNEEGASTDDRCGV